MKTSAKIGATIILLLISFPDFATGKIRDVGRGARAPAMGQAQTAVANDATAVFYNPAALVQARERWDVNGFNMLFQVGQSGYESYLTLNGVDQQYPYTAYTSLNTLLPLGKRLTFGLCVLFPNDWFLFTALNNGPRFSRYAPTQDFGYSYGIGLKITRKLSIGYTSGGNMGFNISTVNLDINALLSGLGLSLGPPPTDLNPYIEVDVLSMSSYQFGILYRPVKWLNLGLNYAYKAPAYTVIPIYLPPSLLPETSLLMEINSSGPTSITFGVGLFPTENLTIAVDIIYDMWSPTNQWTRITSSDPDFLASDYPDVTLRDIWATNVGFEYTDKLRGKLSNAEYAVRAGYGFYPSPYPHMPEGTSNIDNDAHKFSGGFALGFYPKKKFDYIGLEYFWEYVELIERSHVDMTRNPAVIVSDGYVIYTGVSFNIKI